MLRVNVASVLIHNAEGNLLIVKNVRGESSYWSPPGGAVEDGETLEEAAVREVKEETGYNVRITGLHSIREALFTERGHHALIISFTGEIIGGTINIQDPDDDIHEVRWVDHSTAESLMPELMKKLQLNNDSIKTQAFYSYEGNV
ncbi:NUDIX hydrolase [Paenibacillus sp. N1-5-1-14]|nr:NUDIX hydrolase [Paenibacillus radicibacter]